MRVAIMVMVYRYPPRLLELLENMKWAGWPDVPVYIFEDRTPYSDEQVTHMWYKQIASAWHLPHYVTPAWCSMHGCMQFAMDMLESKFDWIIFIPDDVLFTKGGLWNEYAGVLTYGREFVGGIQAPFWDARELMPKLGLTRNDMFGRGWKPDLVPRNPHWEGLGSPRKYVTLNGAGFSLNTKLWRKAQPLPYETWRFDEYLGWQAWKHGMCCITLPGPPRIHYQGASAPLSPEEPRFDLDASWEKATGISISMAHEECRAEMSKITVSEHDGTFDDILAYYGRNQ